MPVNPQAMDAEQTKKICYEMLTPAQQETLDKDLELNFSKPMPGLGNFVGEFLVLLGSFQVNILTTAFAALGLVVAAAYSLIVIQKVFHGQNKNNYTMHDLSGTEFLCFALMMIGLIWMGMYPQTMLYMAQPTLQSLNVVFP